MHPVTRSELQLLLGTALLNFPSDLRAPIAWGGLEHWGWFELLGLEEWDLAVLANPEDSRS